MSTLASRDHGSHNAVMSSDPGRPLGRDAQQEASERASSAAPHGQRFGALALGVLGVVYGDIGTSPIYALHVCFTGRHSVPVSTTSVLGVLSLVFWTLMLVVSMKYILFVLRTDNRGEGGIFALVALLGDDRTARRKARRWLLLLGLAGAAMLFGDAMITPAISVLSAVEGLRLAAPPLRPYVVPITVGILGGLFSIQRFGTAVVGFLFGPLMVLWFLVLAVLGVHGILLAPRVLLAINPWYAVRFFLDYRWSGYLVLGGVFLATTGAEALYADLGHFGRRPIVRVWSAFVLPALLLNYFGQGGLMLAAGARSADLHPFFGLASSGELPALIGLATLATCIASQAAISGVYSLVRQAMQLGQLPQLQVLQTSAKARGQVYLPTVNWMMMAGALLLVLAFRTSDALAGAYGVAVNSTMAVTTVLAFSVARERLGWKLPAALAFLGGFLPIDLAYLGANYSKLPEGGWLPLVTGLALFVLMTTWRRGTELLERQVAAAAGTLETFLGGLSAARITRVPGTGVFFTGRLEQTPPALMQLVRHTGVLYERVILVTVVIEPVARLGAEERIELQQLESGFHRLILRYGFMQTPNVPSELAACARHGLPLELDQVHYIVGQVDMLAGRKARGMARWRDVLFAWLARNTKDATAAYQVPAAQTMAVGLRVGI